MRKLIDLIIKYLWQMLFAGAVAITIWVLYNDHQKLTSYTWWRITNLSDQGCRAVGKNIFEEKQISIDSESIGYLQGYSGNQKIILTCIESQRLVHFVAIGKNTPNEVMIKDLYTLYGEMEARELQNSIRRSSISSSTSSVFSTNIFLKRSKCSEIVKVAMQEQNAIDFFSKENESYGRFLDGNHARFICDAYGGNLVMIVSGVDSSVISRKELLRASLVKSYENIDPDIPDQFSNDIGSDGSILLGDFSAARCTITLRNVIYSLGYVAVSNGQWKSFESKGVRTNIGCVDNHAFIFTAASGQSANVRASDMRAKLYDELQSRLKK